MVIHDLQTASEQEISDAAQRLIDEHETTKAKRYGTKANPDFIHPSGWEDPKSEPAKPNPLRGPSISISLDPDPDRRVAAAVCEPTPTDEDREGIEALRGKIRVAGFARRLAPVYREADLRELELARASYREIVAAHARRSPSHEVEP